MMTAGATRDAAEFCLCAGEPCDAMADLEVCHTPKDLVLWVPLCRAHYEAGSSGKGLEYVVEVHGFLPAFEVA